MIRRVGLGALSGVFATGVMSAAMAVARRAGVMRADHPPREIAARAARALGEPELASGRSLDAAAVLAHLAFGAGAGAAFAALPMPRAARVPAAVAYALGVWATSYAGWLPELGLMPRPEHDEAGRPPTMIAAHIVYGSVLGACLAATG